MTNKIIVTFIKIFLFNSSSSLAFLRIKKSNKINICKNVYMLLLLSNIITSLSYTIIYNYLPEYNIPIINAVVYCIYILFISVAFKMGIGEKIILSIISITFAYISISLAGTVCFIFLKSNSLNLTNDGIVEYTIIGLMQFAFIFIFFKIKRFKDGLPFLKMNNKRLNIIGIILSIIIIIISIVVCVNDNKYLGRAVSIAIFLGGLLMFSWIKKSITSFYKSKMKDRTVEILNEQIKERDQTINELKSELDNALKINHKYNHRLSAMERVISKFEQGANLNTEIAQEYGNIASSLKELSTEYKEELCNSSNLQPLPKTNIFSIDNFLEYMRVESNNQNIEFNLEIDTDVNYMVENLISKNKLETLLGDHIKDAMIAINSSSSKYRNIKVEFLNQEETYKIKFYDTGIEFEIDTLLKLGEEQITTHKNTGGSGIGFMTTFETLKECKASLEIEELSKNSKEENLNNYTKIINIVFDGKNEYRIRTYRFKEIEEMIKNNRIIILNGALQ